MTAAQSSLSRPCIVARSHGFAEWYNLIDERSDADGDCSLVLQREQSVCMPRGSESQDWVQDAVKEPNQPSREQLRTGHPVLAVRHVPRALKATRS